jgi:hypothetical protein
MSRYRDRRKQLLNELRADSVSSMFSARKSPCHWIALILLGILFCTNVYRAATQSIAHDEALTHQYFLRGPFSDVWTKYNANNHLLHTFLCKISISLFGLSELSLRLPSLLGGGLYLMAVYRLAVLVFRDGQLFLLTIGLLSLNPFVLDYLSAARGYGAASAFLLLALYYFLRLDLRSPDKATLRKLGLCAGLAVAANLTLLFPMTALGAVLFLWYWLQNPQGRGIRVILMHAVGPAALTLALVFTLPFCYAVGRLISKHAAEGAGGQQVDKFAFAKATAHRTFYVGAPSLRVGFESLVWASFFRDSRDTEYDGVNPLTGVPSGEAFLIASLTVASIGYGCVLAAGFVGRGSPPASASAKLLMVVSATMLITLGVVITAHWFLRFPYPELRTGLYWIPLVTLACVALTAQLQQRRLVMVLGLIFAGFVIQYGAAFQTAEYLEWRYCSPARPIVERMRLAPRDDAIQPHCIGATWQMEPSLNFYREMFHLTWLSEVRRQPVEETQCSFYVLLYDDRSLVSKRQLRVLLDDPASGAILAIPEAGSSSGVVN